MPLSALVLTLLQEKNLTSESLKDAQRAFAKSHNLSTLPSKSQILQAYFQLLEQGKIEKNADFELLLRKRAIRSLSGIVPIQVLTKPFPCPSRCIFCPNDPEMPKSYIKSEPGAMRAFLNQFDPLKQVYNRLYSLQQTGHKTDKIEMIVLGGTWDFYPRDYKVDFIKQLYDACNTFWALAIKNLTGTANWKYAFEITNQDQIQLSPSLEEAIQINETAQHRIIGLTIETRPEFVTDQNCRDRRAMGVTRIEMGVQSTDDAVLDLNKRGHHLAEVEKALHKLRQYAFKFSIHIMPGLYGSTVEKDIQTFRDVYANPYLKPDEIKLYPTSVIPQTELYELYQQGKYQPITTEEISEIIETTFREIIPPYTRIKRLIRDIPATEISAGSNVTNLSQLMHEKLLKKYQKADPNFRSAFYHRLYEHLQVFGDEERFLSVIANGTKWSVAIQKNTPTGLLRSTRKDAQPASSQTYLLGKAPELSCFRHFVSLDTRSREVRNKKEKTEVLNLVVRAYESSVGQEYFISYEDELGYLYGFTRLLLPKLEERIDVAGLGLETALIRELHVYGSLQSLNTQEESGQKVQHSGLGKQLLETAEKIAQKSDFSKLSVISGVGVREYYRKQGYKLEETYMVKALT